MLQSVSLARLVVIINERYLERYSQPELTKCGEIEFIRSPATKHGRDISLH